MTTEVRTKLATIRDVAREAEVSTSTASRILNKKDTSFPFSQETIGKVQAAAKRLGYMPHFGAQSLSHRLVVP